MVLVPSDFLREQVSALNEILAGAVNSKITIICFIKNSMNQPHATQSTSSWCNTETHLRVDFRREYMEKPLEEYTMGTMRIWMHNRTEAISV